MRYRVRDRILTHPGGERDDFIQALHRMAAAEGLGIASNCLEMTIHLIDQVISRYGKEMNDPEKRVTGEEAFEEFVSRMIRAARARGYSELHEDTFMEARGQCGLIWWCQ